MRELLARCPAARRDTVGVGGMTTVGLRFQAPGVMVDAVQTKYDAYEDTLHLTERADLWALWGDSLRFADGRPVPMRVGALRSLDSAGVVVIDHGDDGTGSYVVQCRHPELAFVVSNDWPAHPATGVVPLTTVAPGDTTRIWRIEIWPGERNPEVDAACRRS